jgi:hypothetical protein
LADAYGFRINAPRELTAPAGIHYPGPPTVEDLEFASQTIRVHFSEPIDPTSFDAADVRITNRAGTNVFPVTDVTPVAGTSNMSWDIKVESFPAGGLIFQLGPGIFDLCHEHLYYSSTWIDTTTPRLLTHSLAVPGPIGPWGSGAHTRSNQLFVGFNKSIDVDSFTAGLTIIGPNGTALPASALSISSFSGPGFNPVPGLHNRNFLISFVPEHAPPGMPPINPWGTYTVMLDAEVEDVFHNPLSPVSFNFDLQPTVFDHVNGFADELAARFEAFPEKWTAFGDPRNPPDPPPSWRNETVAKSLLVDLVMDEMPKTDARIGLGLDDKAASLSKGLALKSTIAHGVASDLSGKMTELANVRQGLPTVAGDARLK